MDFDKPMLKCLTFFNFCHYQKQLQDVFFSNYKKDDFEATQKLITDSKVIKTATLFFKAAFKYLNLLYPCREVSHLKINNKFSKLYFTHFLIVDYTKFIIGDLKEKDATTKLLVRSAVRFQYHYKIFKETKFKMSNLFHFFQDFNKFEKIFEIWKSDDADKLVESMTKNYWELEMVLYQDFSNQEDNGEQIKKDIETQQQEILDGIKKIKGQPGIDKFNSYVPIAFSEDFVSNVRDNLEEAYWDTVIEEASEEPAKLDKLKAVMHELRSLILQIITNNKFDDLKKKVTHYFDIDFIIDMVKNNVYEIAQLKTLFQFLINILNEVDAPFNDKANEESRVLILKNLEEIQSNNNESLTKKRKSVVALCIVLQNLLPKFQNVLSLKNMFFNNNKK